MYVGKIVELSETKNLFSTPKHPYTEALLSAVPKPDPKLRAKRGELLKGDIADPANPPSGCYFHSHFAACHFAETLELTGSKRA